MKNKDIVYAKQAAKIYSDSYKPSYNVFRFMKSIIGVVMYGSSTVSYVPAKKKNDQIKTLSEGFFLKMFSFLI